MASRRALWIAGLLAGLIAVVAVASRAHAPAGGSTTHGVDAGLIWEFVLVGVLALVVLELPLLLWVIRSSRLEMAPSRGNRRGALRRLAFGLIVLLVLFVVAAEHYRGHHNPTTKTGRSHVAPVAPKKQVKPPKAIPFDWLPAAAILSVAAGGAFVIGYLLFRRPARRRPTPAELAARLSVVLDDSLDDLRSERDPRRAVIAAYARMETTLAGAGVPRAAAEAPLEYLVRVLRDLLETSAEALSRLTGLFERAKFSTHEIDAGMKADAIDALVAIRDELRAAAS